MTIEQLKAKITEAENYQRHLMAKAQYELGAIDGQIALMKHMLAEMTAPNAEELTAPVAELKDNAEELTAPVAELKDNAEELTAPVAE